ncbi:MAG: porin [Cyanobacteria bacterium TMED177]|nr:MAG: porin [Cyanobacteria bacterium TMED177]
MKLFQQLLVAPAALGLLASGANAADLNINGVSDYAASEEQVTSITQFSDVYPTDWAYQALANLIERYGCVAGYPNGTFRGNRAMTRYEAAALLNACLDRITEVTDELRRLIKEFETELALIRGRVDGLEARVGELESTQFSTTTKLKGKATFVMGATHAKGDNPKAGGYYGTDSKGNPLGLRRGYNSNYGAFTFSYDLRLGLKTSFTGKDLLFTRLRAGNMDNTPWEGQGVNLTKIDTGMDGDGQVVVDRLYYRFPLGSNFTVIAGPMLRNTEMMGYKPAVYGKGGQKLLDFFAVLGTPGVWSKETGSGFGAIYSNKSNVAKGDAYWTVAANYVADAGEGNNSNPQTGGFMTDNSRGNVTAQIAYGSKKWGVGAGYRYNQCRSAFRRGTQYAAANRWHIPCYNSDGERSGADANSWSFNAFWRPDDSGWIPSISAGVGQSYLHGDLNYNHPTTTSSWMVGLQWSDVFLMGNDLGFAVGQPTFVTETDSGTPDDGNYAMELWYQFQVTDNIAITPGVFWLSRPWGEITPDDKSVGIFGGLVQTVFKF